MSNLWIFDEHMLVAQIEATLQPVTTVWADTIGLPREWARDLYWADEPCKKRHMLVHTPYKKRHIVFCTVIPYTKEYDLARLIPEMSRLGEFVVWDTDDEDTIELAYEAGYRAQYEMFVHTKFEEDQLIRKHIQEDAGMAKKQAAADSGWSLCGVKLPAWESLVQDKVSADGTATTNIGCGALLLIAALFGIVGFLGLFIKIVF